MYIIELFINLHRKFKRGEIKLFDRAKKEETPQETECKHIFVPVDSTKKVLACSKCGYMVRVNGEVKTDNPFND